MIEKISRVLLTAALLAGTVAAQSTIAPVPASPASPAPTPPPAATATLNSAVTLNAANVTPGTAAAPNPILRFAKLSPLGDSPDWSKLQAFAKTMTRPELEAALKEIYTDNSTLPAAWRIEGNALLIQTGDPANPEARIELETVSKPPAESTRHWHRVTELQPYKDRPVLSDLHIALDPGHIGGSYGRIEERFLSFQQGESIQEGDLSLVTAFVLSERLKALGAYVTLVRENAEPVTKARPATLRLLPRQRDPRPRQKGEHADQARPRPLPPLQRRSLGKCHRAAVLAAKPRPCPRERLLLARRARAGRCALRDVPPTLLPHP